MPPTDDYFLTTPRLAFRWWTPDDLPLAEALWRDPDVMHFLGGPIDAARRLETELANRDAIGAQYWPIFLRATGEHVGVCGLKPHDEGVLELGFHLHKAFWRAGYGREAAQAAVDYAFDVLHVRGLFAGHHPRNEASKRLLESLGFEYTHDALYPPTGLQHRKYMLTAARRARSA